jgi:tape measure domain-containing protein
MALNLGNITFGLGANTQGLQRAMADLRQFQAQVNAAAQAQAAGANTAVSAMQRQEHAVRAALQQVLNLNQQMRNAGVPPAMLAQSTRLFRDYTQTMTRSTLSTIDFSRAQDLFTARLGILRRELTAFNGQMGNQQNAGRFAEMLRNLQSASVLAVGPLSGLGSRIAALGSIAGRSAFAIAGFLVGVTATTVGLIALIANSIATAKAVQSIEAAFLATTGSVTLSKIEFQFVADTARELGLNVEKVAEQYSKLSAAAIGTKTEGQGVRDAFKGIVTAGAALHLSGEQIASTILALTQVMSKGRLQGQELTQQLGNAIPGAATIAAAAFGKTTAEFQRMMEEGKVSGDEFVKLFSAELLKRFGDSAQQSAHSLTRSLERLRTEFFLFNKIADETIGISKAYKDSLDIASSSLQFLSRNMKEIVAIAGALTGALLGLVTPAFIGLLMQAGVAIRNMTIAMIGLNAAVSAFSVIGLISTLGRLALVLGAAAGGFLMLRGALNDTSDGTNDFIKDVDNYIKRAQLFGGANKQFTAEMIDQTQQRMDKALAERRAIIDNMEAMRKSIAEAGNLADVKTGNSALKVMEQDAEALGVKIFELGNALRRLGEVGELAIGRNMSKQFEDARKKIAEMATESKELEAALAFKGNKEGFQSMMALHEALKMLRDVPTEELDAMQAELAKLGFEGSSAANALSKLTLAFEANKKGTSDWKAALERTPDTLRDIKKEIIAMNEKALAFRMGPNALESFDVKAGQLADLERLNKLLSQTALNQDEINRVTEQYKAAQANVKAAEKDYKVLKDITDDVSSALTRGFDNVGRSITEAFIMGRGEALRFGDVMKGVLSEVIQGIIRIGMITPIVKNLTNALFEAASMSGGGSRGGGFFGFLGSIGASMFSSWMGGGTSLSTGTSNVELSHLSSTGGGSFAKGGAWSQGVRFLAHGGILNGPTAFNTSSGMAVGGEAGTEGVFPLVRIGGDLGVKAVGGGGGVVVVNIYNNSDSKATAQESKDSDGNMQIDVIIDQITAKNIRNGGLTAQSINQVFGSKQTLARR